ncbi:MAG: HD family phosphohydrolase [Sphingomonadales bacterium]
MNDDVGDSSPTSQSELEQARQLLGATAIRALADDAWSAWRPWLDIPAALAFIAFMMWLLAPAGGDVQPIPVLDTIAAQTIRAERDILVEDRRATELSRQAARQSVVAAFDYDPELYFISGQPVLAAVHAMEQRARDGALDIAARRAAFEADLGRPVNGTTFKLIEGLEQGSDIATAMTFFFNIVLDRLVISDRALLSDAGGLVVRDVATGEIRGLENLRSVIDLAQVRRLMRARAGDAPYGSARIIRTWVLETAMDLIQPNLTANPALLEQLRQAAVDGVEPVYVRISNGEVVIREGDRVTAAVQERLRYLNEGVGNRSIWGEIAALALLVAGFVAAGALSFRSGAAPSASGRRAIYQTLFIVAVTTAFCAASFYGGRGLAEGLGLNTEVTAFLTPAALATVLIALLVSNRMGLVAGVSLSLLLTYRLGGDLWLVIYYLVGVFVAGLTARRCHRRTDILKVGAVVGGAQILALPVLFILASPTHGDGLAHVTAAGFALASGALVALAASALLPILEQLFDETTEMRLLEMASADNKLLKELALKCPGTYYHSVMIANLAEAGGDAIGANGLRCRVMALYHDIGKLARPSYFAENQRGRNIHDRLPPELSARIIFAHIKDGIDIARKHRLGRPIIDAVTQHQGTTLLRVFYRKALDQAQKTGAEVREREFRYPGPRPKSREAGILLLADGVEASTRALKNPSPADVSKRVDELVAEKVADRQLDHCALTLSDLNVIRQAFCRVLTLGVYHSRIEYPPLPGKSGEIIEENDQDRSVHPLFNVADHSS